MKAPQNLRVKVIVINRYKFSVVVDVCYQDIYHYTVGTTRFSFFDQILAGRKALAKEIKKSSCQWD